MRGCLSHRCIGERELQDGKWSWDSGTEGKPTAKGKPPARGMGAFVDTSRVRASLVKAGKYTMWHRVELEGDKGPLNVGLGYFPNAQDKTGHRAANDELREALTEFNLDNDLVVCWRRPQRSLRAGRLPTDKGLGRGNAP